MTAIAKLKTALTAAALAAAMTPAAAAPPERPAMGTQSLAAVSAHLKALGTMTADFTQTARNGKTLSGKLTLARPGRIRFQYQPGVPLLVVANGGALTMIDYQVAQVSRWPIRNTPLGVLLDPSRDPSRFARMLPTGEPGLLLVEAKDPRHPEYGITTLVFRKDGRGPAGLVLQGWNVIDAQNNQTTVQLSNQRYGVPVADSAFRFRDPRPSRQPGR